MGNPAGIFYICPNKFSFINSYMRDPSTLRNADGSIFRENQKFNFGPFLGPYNSRMINYTSFGFASISAAFLNRDGKDCPQCVVAGCFRIIKIIFYLIFEKSKQRIKFEKY